MTDLVAVLSSGKGTWGHVSQLMKDEDWDNIFLITNEFGRENFSHDKKFETVVVDRNKSLEEIKAQIASELGKMVKGAEVAVNMVSGSGKEHMALLSAVLSLGVGLRFVAATEEGVKEL